MLLVLFVISWFSAVRFIALWREQLTHFMLWILCLCEAVFTVYVHVEWVSKHARNVLPLSWSVFFGFLAMMCFFFFNDNGLCSTCLHLLTFLLWYYKMFIKLKRTSSIACVVVGDHIADLWFCKPDQWMLFSDATVTWQIICWSWL